MARALDDIIREISASYNPARERATGLYNQQFAEVAPQEQADLGGLEAAKSNAFESINTGANRRGMFFSGIPLAEQAKYVGENYLPSIAGLKNRYAGIRGNLYQTLSQQLGQYDTEAATRGQGIYQQELDRDEQARQFNEQMAAQERAAAASRASGGSGTGMFTPSTSNIQAPASQAPKAPTIQDQAYLSVQQFLQGSDDQIRSDYNATLQSANYGNELDKLKVQLYQQSRPDLFAPKERTTLLRTGGLKVLSDDSPLGAGLRTL